MNAKKGLIKIAGVFGLAAMMSVGAGEALARNGHDQHHRNNHGPRYDHRYDRHDRRDYRHDFNRPYQRPYHIPAPRPYDRPVPSVCVTVQTYNYRWNRYEWNLVCTTPRAYR